MNNISVNIINGTNAKQKTMSPIINPVCSLYPKIYTVLYCSYLNDHCKSPCKNNKPTSRVLYICLKSHTLKYLPPSKENRPYPRRHVKQDETMHLGGGVCVLIVKPFFLPVDIQHRLVLQQRASTMHMIFHLVGQFRRAVPSGRSVPQTRETVV